VTVRLVSTSSHTDCQICVCVWQMACQTRDINALRRLEVDLSTHLSAEQSHLLHLVIARLDHPAAALSWSTDRVLLSRHLTYSTVQCSELLLVWQAWKCYGEFDGCRVYFRQLAKSWKNACCWLYTWGYTVHHDDKHVCCTVEFVMGTRSHHHFMTHHWHWLSSFEDCAIL